MCYVCGYCCLNCIYEYCKVLLLNMVGLLIEYE